MIAVNENAVEFFRQAEKHFQAQALVNRYTAIVFVFCNQVSIEAWINNRQAHVALFQKNIGGLTFAGAYFTNRLVLKVLEIMADHFMSPKFHIINRQ